MARSGYGSEETKVVQVFGMCYSCGAARMRTHVKRKMLPFRLPARSAR